MKFILQGCQGIWISLQQFLGGFYDSIAWWRFWFWVTNDPTIRKSILNNFRNSGILMVAHLTLSIGLKKLLLWITISDWYAWLINDIIIYFLWAPPLYVVSRESTFFFFFVRKRISVFYVGDSHF